MLSDIKVLTDYKKVSLLPNANLLHHTEICTKFNQNCVFILLNVIIFVTII